MIPLSVVGHIQMHAGTSHLTYTFPVKRHETEILQSFEFPGKTFQSLQDSVGLQTVMLHDGFARYSFFKGTLKRNNK